MLAIAVGVRVTGSDVDTVILKLKGGCETKSKVVQLFLVRHVGNVWTKALPAIVLELSFLFRVEQRSHSMTEERVPLDHVNYVEFVDLLSSGVWHFEVKPLTVYAWAIMIKFQF